MSGGRVVVFGFRRRRGISRIAQVGIGILVQIGSMGIDGLDFEGVGRVDDESGIDGGVQCWHVGALATALSCSHTPDT
jgi:hypothetical protein